MANINYFSDTVNYIVRSGDFSGKFKPNLNGRKLTDESYKIYQKGFETQEKADNWLKNNAKFKDEKKSGKDKGDGKKDSGPKFQTTTWQGPPLATPSSSSSSKPVIDVTSPQWNDNFNRLVSQLATNTEIIGKKVGEKHKFYLGNGKSEERALTQQDIDKALSLAENQEFQLNEMRGQREAYLKSKGKSNRKSIDEKLDEAQKNYTINEYARANEARNSDLNLKISRDSRANIAETAELGAKISKETANAKEDNLRGTKAQSEEKGIKHQDEKDDAKHELWRESNKNGYVKTYGKLLDKEVGSAFDVAGDLYDTVTSKAGQLDKRIFGDVTIGKTSKSKKALEKMGGVNKSVYDSLIAGNTLTKEQYDSLTDKQKKYYDKAAKADEDARTTRRARSIKNAVQTTGDVIGATKDTISSKSRARTLAERGIVGEKRRDARIAYALGDRSLFTKLAAGKSLGSKNAFTRFVGKFPAWATYGRRENKNRKNYAKQLAYNAGFSEGEVGMVLGLLSSHDFSDNEEMHGEGWQYREYPELAKLIEDDKYEKMDADLIEKGEFSELDQVDEVAPEAPVVDSSEIAQHTQTSQQDEVSVSSILNKNYYEASPVEKRFQEMVARGFSQDEEKVNSYENFLEKFSESADTVRRV